MKEKVGPLIRLLIEAYQDVPSYWHLPAVIELPEDIAAWSDVHRLTTPAGEPLSLPWSWSFVGFPRINGKREGR